MIRENVVKTINSLKGEEGHKKVLDVYNSQCPLPRGYKLQAKDPWCAATVSAVFLLNGYDALSEVSCICLLYTSPSPRDKRQSRMPSSA